MTNRGKSLISIKVYKRSRELWVLCFIDLLYWFYCFDLLFYVLICYTAERVLNSTRLHFRYPLFK